jgi:hypothetical protein
MCILDNGMRGIWNSKFRMSIRAGYTMFTPKVLSLNNVFGWPLITDFGLHDWIYCTLYIHTTRDYRQYSAIAILHNLQFTVPHALGFSVFTSRILATDLSQPHCHFNSHMKPSFHSLIPFLPLFCSYQFRRLDSIHFEVHILAGWRLGTRLDWTTVLYYSVPSSVSFYNPSARTTQKTQPLLLRMCVYWSVT